MNAQKRWGIVAAVAAALLCVCAVYANVSGTLRYVNFDGAFRWRDGSVVQERMLVIGLVDIADDGFEPPSTNAANDYCGPGDCRSINPSTPTSIGYDNESFKARLMTNGMVVGLFEAPGRMPRKARFRCFSAKHVRDAAYYGDGGDVMLQAMPDRAKNDSGSWTLSLVNPAYTRLMFDGPPKRQDIPASGTNDAACAVITGKVNTCPGGANNMLDNKIVMVYWRTNKVDIWKPLGDFKIQDEGDFSGVCPDVMDLMVGMIVDPTALPTSLLGQGPVVPLGGKGVPPAPSKSAAAPAVPAVVKPAAKPAAAPAKNGTNEAGWTSIE